ncbi:MAG TPA: hypothetical protein VHC95_06300 [Opitutales bacterium]|nr:hypothetical protein [Opitutales bacterium]
MKQVHHYENPLYNRPSQSELAVFTLILLLGIWLFVLLGLAGCAASALPGQTPAEHKLNAAQSAQLSHAAAAVQAAKSANAANPDGLPKTATAGELGVADANLPEPKPEDAREALARVNAALTGKLAEAEKAWADAEAKGGVLQGKISGLEKQVAAEKAATAANEKKANDRLCIIAALMIGGVFGIAAGLSLTAGIYFSLPKLEYGAGGLGVAGALAFFAATQVGSVHFNDIATVVILGGMAAAIYSIWHGFAGGSVIQTKAGGFERAMSVVKKLADEVAGDVETDAKKIWRWLAEELDQAHKVIIADWQKLETVFADPPAPLLQNTAGGIPPQSGTSNN